MACCVIGSMLMVGVVGLVRGIKERVLRRQGAAPESWRLHG